MARLTVAELTGVIVAFVAARTAVTPFVESRSRTVPANPSMLVRVIVELALCPFIKVKDAGLGEILKSGPVTFTLTKIECESIPLVPLTSTEWNPKDVVFEAEKLNNAVAIPPDNSVAVEFNDTGNAPKLLALRLTVPAKLSRLDRLTVDLPLLPCRTLMNVGLAEIVKSGPVTVIATRKE